MHSLAFIYRIFVHSKAFLCAPQSIILLLPPPYVLIAHTIAVLLRKTTNAQCVRPPPAPLVYAIHYTILAVTKSCKGQFMASPDPDTSDTVLCYKTSKYKFLFTHHSTGTLALDI